MVELYKTKGMDTKDAKLIIDVMSKYKEAWVNIMMIEELELGGSEENPIKNALVTFVSFILFGLVPSK